uniref:Uncharacterized protein n=1 Tax=Oryzias latipes TaxID=8090 RepID=A0A3P9MJ89_ORYLA
SVISSCSLEQSFPAAAFSSCTKTWSSSKLILRVFKNIFQLALRSILAKPRALDALSLASWNNSLSDRLVSITDRLGRKRSCSKTAVLSSALSQNSLPLFCSPASRNSPVDSSSIPAMKTHQKSSPDWASPPRM